MKKEMNCRLCNNDKLKIFYKQGNKDQFHFYKCNKCGLVNLDLNGLTITDHQGKYFDIFKPIENYEECNGARTAYTFVKKHVPVKGSYLDIGCGGGALLYFAKKDGWDCKGVEISPGYVKFVKEKLQIDVYTGDFLEINDIKEQFDVVSLRHVLEHLPDSILAMNKISALLKKGGYGHFEFPNINSISDQIQRFFTKTGIHKKKYPSTYQPGHCNEFSRKSFKYLLKQTGFKLIRWEAYSGNAFSNFLYYHTGMGSKIRVIVQKIN